MIPIQELLSRIRWDPGFGDAQFTLGYYDRVENRIMRIALREVRFDPDDRFDFRLFDPDGREHRVPLHRIREVYRDGALIWKRPGPARGRGPDSDND